MILLMVSSKSSTTSLWSCQDSGDLPWALGFGDFAGEWCVSGNGCWLDEWVQFVNISLAIHLSFGYTTYFKKKSKRK